MLRCVFFLLVILGFAGPVAASTAGKLKICKDGSPEDWPDPEWWRREVVVPAGAVFKDNGPVDDATGPLVKLRIITTEAATIRGKQKCKVVGAIIPDDLGDWGNLYKGPVLMTIGTADKRLLTLERWGNSDSPPPKLAPWSDVAPVEATVEQDFR